MLSTSYSTDNETV